MAYFVVIQEPGKKEHFVPVTGKLVIGRDSECDIQCNCLTLSRLHGEFNVSKDEEQLFYKDLGSRNGSFKNEILLNPGMEVEIVEGDILLLGKLKISCTLANLISDSLFENFEREKESELEDETLVFKSSVGRLNTNDSDIE